ncbi:YqaJ viral recombinase family protein [Vibrio metoecus]|nr:hypothetical protein [Vibrio cholerae]
MNIIFVKDDIRQGSPEWEAWRNEDNGVGSSDVSVIVGKSKYKSCWRLWAEKRGLVPLKNLSANPNVRRGKRLEASVRLTVEKVLNKKLNVCCGHDKSSPWRKASFDGVFDDLIPVEIKCPSTNVSGDETPEELEQLSKDRYVDLLRNGAKSILFNDNEVQLQYQIGLLNAPFGYLVFYFEHNNEMKIYKVPRNEEMIKDIFEKVDNFSQGNLAQGIPPDMNPELDSYEPSEKELIHWDCQTMEFLEAIVEERELHKKLREIKARKEAAASQLFQMAGDFRRLDLHGVIITHVKPRESFAWKEYIHDKGIEISDSDQKRYTTKGKASFRVSPNRDKGLLTKVKQGVVSHQRQAAMDFLLQMTDEEREEIVSKSENNIDEFYD